MRNLNFNLLKVGDRLVRTKGGVFSKHHAIFMGFHYGEYLVAENQAGYGVRYITLNQFLSEGQLTRVEYSNYNQYNQNLIIKRVNNRVGRSYDWFNYNCETFVNDVLTGVATSKQIQAGIFLTTLIGISCIAYQANRK